MRMESVFFYVGCAVGFDMMAAYAVLEQKKQYPDMVLIAVVPYAGQDRYFKILLSGKTQKSIKILLEAP